jgi:hypothetical protein
VAKTERFYWRFFVLALGDRERLGGRGHDDYRAIVAAPLER